MDASTSLPSRGLPFAVPRATIPRADISRARASTSRRFTALNRRACGQTVSVDEAPLHRPRAEGISLDVVIAATTDRWTH